VTFAYVVAGAAVVLGAGWRIFHPHR